MRWSDKHSAAALGYKIHLFCSWHSDISTCTFFASIRRDAAELITWGVWKHQKSYRMLFRGVQGKQEVLLSLILLLVPGNDWSIHLTGSIFHDADHGFVRGRDRLQCLIDAWLLPNAQQRIPSSSFRVFTVNNIVFTWTETIKCRTWMSSTTVCLKPRWSSRTQKDK